MKTNDRFKEIAEIYNQKVNEYEKLNYFVRSDKLHKISITEMNNFIKTIRDFKIDCIKKRYEQIANSLYHFQCVINSYISLYNMWISLKENDFEKSWCFLIDSQEYLSVAMRAANSHFGLDDLMSKIKKIEEIIFPGFPYYNSIGAIIKGGICSICGNSFDECGHIEDYIYWGGLCRRIQYEIVEVNHAALVTEPKDRRCIIKKISTDDGHYRNYFTWEETEDIVEEHNSQHLTIEATLFSLKTIELF